MKRYRNPMIAPTLFGLSLSSIFMLCLAMIILRGCDFSAPILSERNPDGSIDYWYLFSNAEIGGNHE